MENLNGSKDMNKSGQNLTKVLVLRGMSSSGKSTWAKEQVKNSGGQWKRVNKDSLREMLDCKEYSKTNEKIIESVRDLIIKECLRQNINVIVDDTNLSERHINKIERIVEWHNNAIVNDCMDYGLCGKLKSAKIEILWFPITLDEALHRNNTRPKEEKVPEKILCEMYRKYIKIGGPLPNPTPIYNPELPDCIIIDMDGTLSDFTLNRGPFEQEKCANDKCVEPVAQIIFAQHRLGNKIIIMSGRYDTYRPQTMEFLNKYDIPYDELFMRSAGDNRSDDIVKEELYKQNVEGKYNVLFAIDDRPRVIRMWRNKLGLFVFNVGSGLDF